MFELKIDESTEKHLRHTHEVMPNSDPGIKLLPRPVTRPTTANASNEIPLVPSATPSTTVSTDQRNTTPVQTDKSQTDQPVETAQRKQTSPPPLMTTRCGRVVRPPTCYQRFAIHQERTCQTQKKSFFGAIGQ